MFDLGLSVDPSLGRCPFVGTGTGYSLQVGVFSLWEDSGKDPDLVFSCNSTATSTSRAATTSSTSISILRFGATAVPEIEAKDLQ
jgi:hypothetical protein